jgi:hypothetical protein
LNQVVERANRVAPRRVRAIAATWARLSGWCRKIADSTTVTTTEEFEAAEATATGRPAPHRCRQTQRLRHRGFTTTISGRRDDGATDPLALAMATLSTPRGWATRSTGAAAGGQRRPTWARWTRSSGRSLRVRSVAAPVHWHTRDIEWRGCAVSSMPMLEFRCRMAVPL